MVSPYNGILFNNKTRNELINSCYTINEPWRHCALLTKDGDIICNPDNLKSDIGRLWIHVQTTINSKLHSRWTT